MELLVETVMESLPCVLPWVLFELACVNNKLLQPVNLHRHVARVPCVTVRNKTLDACG
jgi:hypothetical protein